MKYEDFNKQVHTFFEIYDLFLTIDSIASVSEIGRNRELVGLFLIYFTSIVKNSENQISDIIKHKSAVKEELKAYIKSNAYIKKDCLIGERSAYHVDITQKINHDLSKALNAFLKASKLYRQHRAKLANQEIIELYKRNALDYYLTAFGTEDQEKFKNLLDEYTDSKIIKKITMYKQALMEFNNAISHINSAFKKSSTEKNIERAEQHLNRGALDFYKSIIKELFILNKIDNTNIEELKELRCSEFNSIGEDRYKLAIQYKSLYDKYYDFCNKTI